MLEEWLHVMTGVVDRRGAVTQPRGKGHVCEAGPWLGTAHITAVGFLLCLVTATSASRPMPDPGVHLAKYLMGARQYVSL